MRSQVRVGRAVKGKPGGLQHVCHQLGQRNEQTITVMLRLLRNCRGQKVGGRELIATKVGSADQLPIEGLMPEAYI
ncbi:hypothetical protein VN97_g9910 [Penicillium thymicola]|uniref:Uncharacterized protein n=1 Tax=Penicillium thymicola TaxID=293382 RepID=A0AAI9X4L5_PENTH|nr:hypothetical protein VN97_g9910 [Penicillium thymicola]